MLPSSDRSINPVTRCWTLSEGWNATTASGVVPAAMKSIISSYDLVDFIVLNEPWSELFQHNSNEVRRVTNRGAMRTDRESVVDPQPELNSARRRRRTGDAARRGWHADI